MIIAIDFDGTLCIDKYPEIGVPAPYAVDTMQTLHKAGHYLIINTCREGRHLIDAINWLKEHDIPFNRVNDNHPDTAKNYEYNARKYLQTSILMIAIWAVSLAGSLPISRFINLNWNNNKNKRYEQHKQYSRVSGNKDYLR